MKHHYKSSNLTLGLELELQLINSRTQDLSSRAKHLIRNIQNSSFKQHIKPEITQSMIEINSSIHYKPASLYREMKMLCHYLKRISDKEKVSICGGGTHPFQDWSERKIFPTHRFRDLLKKYGYLAKRFTIFSMHTHIGCKSPDMAIYLTHMLSRFVPQLIALSASSPFYNGINTGYNSTRISVNQAFPLSGHMPNVKDWSEFCRYYNKMYDLNIIKSMKDFYWDIRPKPEFGTVEVRVCDMPLSLSKATMLAAYIQTLSSYIMHESNHQYHANLYEVYDYNRFEAARHGYDGEFVNPFTFEVTTVQKDILTTLKMLRNHAKSLGTTHYLRAIKKLAKGKQNDAAFLKNKFADQNSLLDTVKNKCHIWKYSLTNSPVFI